MSQSQRNYRGFKNNKMDNHRDKRNNNRQGNRQESRQESRQGFINNKTGKFNTNSQQENQEERVYVKPNLSNSLSTISFCDKVCYNVNQNTAKDKLINYIQGKYPIQIIKNQYVMINPRILYNITKHEHIITTLTNGNPYLMFLTIIDGIKWCIFIDRKLKTGYSYPKIHCTQYNFDEELFKSETIFNGELVRDVNRHWKFIINDIFIYKGVDITKQKNYLSRIELLHNIMTSEYTYTADIEICPIQIKKVFQYSEINYIFDKFIPDLSYTCKGLIFNTLSPKFTSYVWILPKEQQIRVRKMNNEEAELGFVIDGNKTFVKPKDVFSNCLRNSIPDSCYIDKERVRRFKITNAAIPDIYNLYSLTDNDDNSLDDNNGAEIAFIPNIKISNMLYNYFKEKKEIDAIVECVYHKHFERWCPVEII